LPKILGYRENDDREQLAGGCLPNFGFLLTMAAALAVAFICGLVAQRMKLSPVVGYLLAGVLVGPYTPGFVANQELASQMAELGVILLMFGVGLRFRLRDLWQVRRVSLPGAFLQSALAAGVTTVAALSMGWTPVSGLVLGVSIAVSSTVVMTRVLSDEGLLDTPAGHIAVGWTVTEDFITVLALVLLPALVGGSYAGGWTNLTGSVGLALGKVVIVAAVLLIFGSKLIPYLLLSVARTRSNELFTLCVLVIVLSIATVSSVFFGVSLALGAFLAGIVVGHSRLSIQAAADALPLRDAFAVLFFVSIGMLFDPLYVLQHPKIILIVVGVVLLIKPACAFLITLALGKPAMTSLTVALCIAQIGEFSFIMAELGRRLGVLPKEGHVALVAASVLSIAINPLLVRSLKPLEISLRRGTGLGRLFRTGPRHAGKSSDTPAEQSVGIETIIVGYGPVGRNVHRVTQDFGLRTMIVDTNPDTVHELHNRGIEAIFGDASRREVLLSCGIARAKFLVVTVPDILARIAIITTARIEAPELEIITRARYLQERLILEESGATSLAFEEAEIAVSLASQMLLRLGASPEDVEAEAISIRRHLYSHDQPAI
jgi:CPA2 family monovalent cation:H+ antiporter-2